jgi:hypothetical protein
MGPREQPLYLVKKRIGSYRFDEDGIGSGSAGALQLRGSGLGRQDENQDRSGRGIASQHFAECLSVKEGEPRFDNHHCWWTHQRFDERLATTSSVNNLTSCKPQRFSIKRRRIVTSIRNQEANRASVIVGILRR